MINVKQYTFTVFCCSIAAALAEYAAPQSCKKQISYITGMIMLINLLSPFTMPLDGSLTADNHTETKAYFDSVSANHIVSDQFKENLSVIIQDKLASVGIIADDIRIEIIMSDNEFSLGDIEVILSGTDEEEAAYADRILEELLEVEIKVVTRGDGSDDS